jgi:CO dehydrogenase maturation factor
LGIKVAVAGKGGVGKTTVVGSLARVWAQDGMKVIAVDADPAAHLYSILEIPPGDLPRPISSELDLIEERTGARPGASTGPFFKLNPKVDDIPERYASIGADGVRLLELGTIKGPGSGCFCPEHAILRGLLEHLILERDEAVLVDMEAGLEQFGRATSRGVDVMLVIVEPGSRSVETAARIVQLSKELGIRSIFVVANRIARPDQEAAVSTMLSSKGLSLFHALPHSRALADADLLGKSVFAMSEADAWVSSVRELSKKILSNRPGP